MKQYYTISRNCQERSFSELETLHHLCESERKQILQNLALAYSKYLMQVISCQVSAIFSMIIMEISSCNILVQKKSHHCSFWKKEMLPTQTYIFFKKIQFENKISQSTLFWDTIVLFGSENSHNVKQLNPNYDKIYLLTLHILVKCHP